MKKILGFLFALMMMLTSCSGVSQKAIDEKIEKEGIDANFSQKEYEFMADYALSHFNPEDSQSSNYMFVLLNASVEGKLDASNEEKCKELQSKAKQYQSNF